MDSIFLHTESSPNNETLPSDFWLKKLKIPEIISKLKIAFPPLYDELQSLYEKISRICSGANIVIFLKMIVVYYME